MKEIYGDDPPRTIDDDMLEISENYICAFILPFYDAMPDGQSAVDQVISLYEGCNGSGAYSTAVSLTEWIYQTGDTQIPAIIQAILNTPDLHEAFFRNFLKSLKDSWCED